ncbi:AlbA family DNA-binding domain-containing protein [Pseudomonas chlororaphis]|uniref:AlbA family DNA-binding domain-containing protein n=1 Tax=Pseudomonas chlororaphis TaxID=587753 RepID=UPI001B309597|nr:ATP-binding protein [Pseudomonas chlororaphis]QTT89388.1 ATP-binding protein [Pseudomonas chlororaphis]
MSAIAVSERARTAIELGESHFREFKSALEGPPGEKRKRPIKDIATNIAQTLVAFANADGGELLVGVEDNGEVSGLPGFSEADYASLEAAPTTRVHSSTPLPPVKLRRLSIEGKGVLYFSVPKEPPTNLPQPCGKLKLPLSSVPLTVKYLVRAALASLSAHFSVLHA